MKNNFFLYFILMGGEGGGGQKSTLMHVALSIASILFAVCSRWRYWWARTLTYNHIKCYRHRDSYISAHVLLNLLNKLRKADKTRGLSSILSLFLNEFNKLDNTEAQMFESIYHMTLRLLKKHIFGMKASRFCQLFRNVIKDVIMQRYKICLPLVVYLF